MQRRTGTRCLGPVLLVFVAVAGLLGTGQSRDAAAAAVRNSATAMWATTAGVEAVLPAKLETAFDRSGLASSSKQRTPLGVLVLPAVLASVIAARAIRTADVPRPALGWSRALAERGPPLRRFALT